MPDPFDRKSPPIPPPLPSAAIPPPLPPIIPKPPRQHHRQFSHDVVPDAFLGPKRAGFVALLFRKELQEAMRSGWTAVGKEFGAAAIPATALEVSVFRHEAYIFCFFQFPPA